jgi:hypothetical protein
VSENRFDQLTKDLGTGRSRRSVLKTLAGGAAAAALAAVGLTAVGVDDVNAEGCRSRCKRRFTGARRRRCLDACAAPAPGSGPGVVFVGAGDIASSGSGDDQTAALLDGIPGTVFTLGDNAYENGSASDYANDYAPTWGRHQARTRPVPGNHDYQTGGAAGYFGYFGAAAGDPATGYYSYDLGSWHVVALNSNLGMAAGSAQEQWLRADLAAHPGGCTLAYWHHARFSSGATHGSDPRSQGAWQALAEAGAEVVLTGHDHDYERFAPLDAAGNRDDALGVREFVVGTGGRSHYSFGTILPASQAHNADTYGVLKLTLRDGGYDWAFVPVAGGSFTDAGSGTCH